MYCDTKNDCVLKAFSLFDVVLTFAFLDDDPHDALDTLHDDGIRTLLRRLPRPDWSKIRVETSDWSKMRIEASFWSINYP